MPISRAIKGKTVVANVVMLGALVVITNIIRVEAFRKSLLSNIPKGKSFLEKRVLI